MRLRNVAIRGTGVCIPPLVRAEDAVEAGLYDRDDHEFYGWTSAAVAGNEPAPDMAIKAARQALTRAGVRSEEIDGHVHACGHAQGPDGWAAQHYILHHLTDRDVPSYRVWQACSGMVGAIELAAGLLAVDSNRENILLTGSDNVNHPRFNRWSFGIQNGIIGDSGSALVVSRTPGFAQIRSMNSGSTAEIERLYRGNEPIFPPTAADAGPVDFRERLAAGSDDLGDVVAAVVERQGDLRTELALKSIAEANIDVNDVTRVCHVFTGQQSYLQAIIQPMGLSTDLGLLDFGRQFGHLTVSDQIVGLNHLLETQAVDPGAQVLVVAHGGGVTVSCAVIEILEQPRWSESPLKYWTSVGADGSVT